MFVLNSGEVIFNDLRCNDAHRLGGPAVETGLRRDRRPFVSDMEAELGGLFAVYWPFILRKLAQLGKRQKKTLLRHAGRNTQLGQS